jgi:hypothetical protein
MRSLALAAAAVLALLALPSAASAHHLVASATIDAKLGSLEKDGRRELTLNWNVSCGDPDATAEVEVGRLIKPKNPNLAPVTDTFEAEATQGPGSAQTMVSSGSRFSPIVLLECSKVDEADVSHSASTSASGAELYLPPRLVGYDYSRFGLCGVSPTKRNLRKMQVGEPRDLQPVVSFNSHSMLKNPRSVKGVVLRIKGGGMNARVRGRSRQGIFAFSLPVPKRAGRARVWIEFDGTPTNRITIPILPKRC